MCLVILDEQLPILSLDGVEAGTCEPVDTIQPKQLQPQTHFVQVGHHDRPVAPNLYDDVVEFLGAGDGPDRHRGDHSSEVNCNGIGALTNTQPLPKKGLHRWIKWWN